jgi:hypothetical protein
MFAPTLAVKLTQYSKGKAVSTSLITQPEIENIVKNYISNHSDDLLNSIMSSYYNKYNNQEHDDKINNAILFFEKILFDEKLPKILSKEADKPNIAVFFSDFDLIVPIFEEMMSFPSNLKVNFFFRQIVTQSKFSGIIARYGCAIYEVNQNLYLPFYLSVLKIPKKELDQEKIENIIKKMDIDFEKVTEIFNSTENEKIILDTNNLTNQLGIDQLPAFIFDNGRVIFGNYGFQSVKKLMYDEK